MYVKDRFKNSFEFWENVIKPSSFIINVIRFGYRIEFLSLPEKIFLVNNKSALDNQNFVEKAILDLVRKNLVTECFQPPYCVNPLTVSMPLNKKPRLILDLRHVNTCIMKRKFKFEGVPEGLDFARKDRFMIKFDLTSGYHHINIHPDHFQYLGFSWEFNGTLRYFTFTVLPFGLSSAAHIFTKVLRPLVLHWRSQGYNLIMYLDDGWACDSESVCSKISAEIQSDLYKAGFLVNQEKSIWIPVQRLEWLGFEWNLSVGYIGIPKHKLENLRVKINTIKNKKSVSARDLSSVVGSIISFKFAFGPVCQMTTRNLSSLISNAPSWDDPIFLSLKANRELDFWQKNVFCISPRIISPWFRAPERIVFTDASDFAGSGILLSGDNKEFFHFMLEESDLSQSSTFRELKTVDLFLETLGPKLANKFVKLYSDNQNVVRISHIGSMNMLLHDLAFSIFATYLRYNIDLSVAWVPRNQNTEADFYSKIFDFDDWGVNHSIFEYFNQSWGPYTCDVFASNTNFKVKKFYSLFWNPGTSGVDAFAFDWSRELSWLVPPISLVNKAIIHILSCKGQGTLVVPKWKSAIFWPSLIDHEGNFNWFITEFREYKNPTNFFIPGSDTNSIFAAKKFNSNVLVLKIDAKVRDCE